MPFSRTIRRNRDIIATIEDIQQAGYDGIGPIDLKINVTGDAVINNVAYTSNGTYTYDSNGEPMSSYTFDIDVPSDINNQDKTVNITSNTPTVVSADSGYSGLGTVTINPNVQPNLTTRTYEFEKNNDNPVTLRTPSGYDGYSSVTIDAPLQDKTVTISQNGQISFECDSSYYGLKSLSATVNVPTSSANLSSLSVMLNKNSSSGTKYFTPEEGYDGFSSVEVTASLENATETITSNGTFTIEPSNVNYYGLKKATVTVNVPTPSIPILNKFSISVSPDSRNSFTLNQSDFTYVSNNTNITVDASKMLIALSPSSSLSNAIRFQFWFADITSGTSFILRNVYYYVLNYGYTNTPFYLYGYDENNNVLSIYEPKADSSNSYYFTSFLCLKSSLPTWIANL